MGSTAEMSKYLPDFIPFLDEISDGQLETAPVRAGSTCCSQRAFVQWMDLCKARSNSMASAFLETELSDIKTTFQQKKLARFLKEFK
jgi:hypothetical protein